MWRRIAFWATLAGLQASIALAVFEARTAFDGEQIAGDQYVQASRCLMQARIEGRAAPDAEIDWAFTGVDQGVLSVTMRTSGGRMLSCLATANGEVGLLPEPRFPATVEPAAGSDSPAR